MSFAYKSFEAINQTLNVGVIPMHSFNTVCFSLWEILGGGCNLHSINLNYGRSFTFGNHLTSIANAKLWNKARYEMYFEVDIGGDEFIYTLAERGRFTRLLWFAERKLPEIIALY